MSDTTPPRRGRVRRFLARRRNWVAVGIVLALTGLVFSAAQKLGSKTAPQSANVPLLLEERKWAAAIAACDARIARGEAGAEVRLWRATARRRVGTVEDRTDTLKGAVEDASEAVRLEPSARAFVERAQSRILLAQFPEALADSEEAVRLAPTDARARAARGDARAVLNRYAEAETDFAEALRLDPDCAEALLSAGKLAVTRGQFARAETVLARAAELAPWDSAVWCARAELRDAQNRPADALAELDRALGAEPRCVHALALRVALCFDARDADAARTASAAALAINPDSGLALVARALLRLEQGRETHALEDLDRAAAAVPNGPLAPLVRASRDLLRDRHADVIRACDRAEQAPGGNVPELYLLRARAHLLHGSPQSAAADCDRALAVRDTDPAALVFRSAARERLGMSAAAQADMDRAVEIDRAGAHRDRARIALDLKDPGRAIVESTKWIAADPKNPEAHAVRAAARFRSQPPQIEEGIADCDRAVELAPTFALGFATRTHGHFLARNPNKAREDAARATAVDGDFVDGWVLAAQARLELEQFAEAASDASAALALEPNSAHALAVRGLARAELKDFANALADAKRAAELEPEYNDLPGLVEQARTPPVRFGPFPPPVQKLNVPKFQPPLPPRGPVVKNDPVVINWWLVLAIGGAVGLIAYLVARTR